MTETPVLPVFMQRDGFDPVPELTALRKDEGVRRLDFGGGYFGWLVTRFEDVRTVLSDPGRFSNARQAAMQTEGLDEALAAELAASQVGNLLTLDPPEHGRLRRLLTPEFTMRRIGRLEPRITEIVADHLDAMERKGPPADLVAEFAMPIPSLVICELLGVPYTDRAEFQELGARQLDQSLPPQEQVRAQTDARTYMARLVAKARTDPGEDMLGMLVREHGDAITSEELTGVASLLLVAGHETTANMLGLGTLALLRHPDQLALVRDDPDAVGPAIEELMRWLSILHAGTAKVTTTDVELSGRTIGAGELIICVLAAANRDPALVERPDELDVRRGALGHVGFGHGVHHCLGAPLARMEMRIAFPALLRRFPDLRAVGSDMDARIFSAIYGLSSLPVQW
ncbi:cytochrome P450 [Pseudonocardia sp. GCM10023141]|uniref:cytochrome P450 n=1 Tax=Pseudonocardia sp. GCM10023141 TaxID=3252653 RepID=UPI00361CED05